MDDWRDSAIEDGANAWANDDLGGNVWQEASGEDTADQVQFQESTDETSKPVAKVDDDDGESAVPITDPVLNPQDAWKEASVELEESRAATVDNAAADHFEALDQPEEEPKHEGHTSGPGFEEQSGESLEVTSISDDFAPPKSEDRFPDADTDDKTSDQEPDLDSVDAKPSDNEDAQNFELTKASEKDLVDTADPRRETDSETNRDTKTTGSEGNPSDSIRASNEGPERTNSEILEDQAGEADLINAEQKESEASLAIPEGAISEGTQANNDDDNDEDDEDDDFGDFEDTVEDDTDDITKDDTTAKEYKLSAEDLNSLLSLVFTDVETSPQQKVPDGPILDIEIPNAPMTARRLFNELSRPTRQFVMTNQPDPVVRWNLSAVHQEVDGITRHWKQKKGSNIAQKKFSWSSTRRRQRFSPAPSSASSVAPSRSVSPQPQEEVSAVTGGARTPSQSSMASLSAALQPQTAKSGSSGRILSPAHAVHDKQGPDPTQPSAQVPAPASAPAEVPAQTPAQTPAQVPAPEDDEEWSDWATPEPSGPSTTHETTNVMQPVSNPTPKPTAVAPNSHQGPSSSLDIFGDNPLPRANKALQESATQLDAHNDQKSSKSLMGIDFSSPPLTPNLSSSPRPASLHSESRSGTPSTPAIGQNTSAPHDSAAYQDLDAFFSSTSSTRSKAVETKPPATSDDWNFSIFESSSQPTKSKPAPIELPATLQSSLQTLSGPNSPAISQTVSSPVAPQQPRSKSQSPAPASHSASPSPAAPSAGPVVQLGPIETTKSGGDDATVQRIVDGLPDLTFMLS